MREARIFPSREEAQTIVDILGAEWEVRSGDKAGKYIMVSKIKQESAAPVAQ